MASSNFNTILNSVKTVIAGLGLSYNSVAVPVNVRKLPAAQEGIDAPPLIVVAPSTTPPRMIPFDTEGHYNVLYTVLIALLFAGNRDLATNLDLVLSFQQQIPAAFRPTSLLNAPTVWDKELIPGVTLDPSLYPSNWDYSALAIRFSSYE